jgi:hypothetical protein
MPQGAIVSRHRLIPPILVVAQKRSDGTLKHRVISGQVQVEGVSEVLLWMNGVLLGSRKGKLQRQGLV